MRRELRWNVTTSNVIDTGMVWLYFSPIYRGGGDDMYRLDEGVVGSGVGLFLIVGYRPKLLPQTSKGAS
jgi:hypothetical protein